MANLTLDFAGLTALPWGLVALSTIIISLRIFIRTRLRTFGAEDYLIVLAWCGTVATASIFEYTIVSYKNNITPEASELYRFSIAEATLLYSSGFFAKASVALLLLRLIGPTSRSLRITIISSVIIYSGATFLAILAAIIPPCDPSLSLQKSLPSGICIPDGDAWVAFPQTWNFSSAILDMLYSLLATRIIYRLQITTQKKISLAVVLSLGWTTAVLATWRAIGAWVYTPEQKQVLNIIAISLEANLVIICASLPTLAPLFEYWRTGKPLTPRGSAGGTPRIQEPAERNRGRLRVAFGGEGKSRSSDRSTEELLSPVEREAASKGLGFSESVMELKPVMARLGAWGVPV